MLGVNIKEYIKPVIYPFCAAESTYSMYVRTYVCAYVLYVGVCVCLLLLGCPGAGNAGRVVDTAG